MLTGDTVDVPSYSSVHGSVRPLELVPQMPLYATSTVALKVSQEVEP